MTLSTDSITLEDLSGNLVLAYNLGVIDAFVAVFNQTYIPHDNAEEANNVAYWEVIAPVLSNIAIESDGDEDDV